MVTNTELDPQIGQYQHESQRPRADEAIFTIRKVASIVKPIMRRRNWHVGTLSEFYPSESNLLGLNINRGEKINLRLRYARDANQFLPIEEVVDTMLHELCHNEIGPHNAQFHALWDQLRDEHEALARKGYTGEGFLGHGSRLGGARIPMHEAKRRARAAAEKRRTLTAGSGQRLGGSGILRGQDARSIIADTIERRLRVERGCASNTDAGRKVAHDESIKKEKVTTTQADREDANEATMMQAYIDLIEEEESAIFGDHYTPPSASNPLGSRNTNTATSERERAKTLLTQQQAIEREILKQKQQSTTTTPIPSNPKPRTTRTTNPSHRPNPTKMPITIIDEDLPHPVPQSDNTWTCEICTLVNPINYLTCDACTVERPASTIFPSRPAYHTNTASTNVKSSSAKPKPKTTSTTPNALKPRLTSAQAHDRFERERAAIVASKPVGWQCFNCGNWMEQEWWTCSACGRMKASS